MGLKSFQIFYFDLFVCYVMCDIWLCSLGHPKGQWAPLSIRLSLGSLGYFYLHAGYAPPEFWVVRV